MLNSSWCFFRYKIRRCFLYCKLALECRRHAFAVPLEAARVVLVEEVDLVAGGPHVRVDSDELQQGARAALLYTYRQKIVQIEKINREVVRLL